MLLRAAVSFSILFALGLSLSGVAHAVPCSRDDQCTVGQACHFAFCNEGSCAVGTSANGTPCSQDSNPCSQDICQGGACTHPPVAAGTSVNGCNAAATECSGTDTCDGAGNCAANDYASTTACGSGTCSQCDGAGTCKPTTAGQQGPNCTGAAAPPCVGKDTCDGAGHCNSNDAAAGTPCTDSSPTDCKVAACDGSGTCTQTFKNSAEGAACGDGVCEQCSAGACGHSPTGKAGPGCNAAATECADAATCEAGGVCDPNPKAMGVACTDTTPADCKAAKCNGAGACNQTFTNAADGTGCGDGVCNECLAGACTATPDTIVGPGCTADSNACTFDYCNGAGACYHPPKTGASCDDGDPCSYGDQCNASAACLGTKVECKSDICASRACNGTSTCTVLLHDDAECDADGDKCTAHDKCKAGVCTADAPTVCAQEDCHTEVTCNKTTGDCESSPQSGVDCGVTGCYTAGTCTDGMCSGTAVDCSGLDDECMVGVCDTAAPGSGTEKCRQQRQLNGTACSTANKCLLNGVCVTGKCTGDIKACSTTTPCRVAECDPATGECVEKPAEVGTPCADDNACVQNVACNAAGNCEGTTLPDTTPCSSSACGASGVCMAGECTCASGADLATGGGAADLAGGATADLSNTNEGGKDAGGCSVTDAASASAWWNGVVLLFGLTMARRRRG